MCLAIPGKLVEVTSDEELAREGIVDFQGIRKKINITFTPEAQPGDYVLVHVGFSISKIDETAAQRTLDTLRDLGELDELNEENKAE
ncbi:MAG: HypC/HybG/HupF family hydrogenase formation chaperone [Verrucomicrobia bacterium]|nr:HypC/HybG/HupF family hydrogenase formation chaperone [Verrucomicrobiota bacterium]MDA1067999.1 HypC/HybG/HupF family hydrogenase formation chaperone [Verrucomicrobiota bacterium]